MKRKLLMKKVLSAGLAQLLLLSTALAPLPSGLFAREVNAAEAFYTVSASDLKTGVNVLPEALADDEAFLNAYVRVDGTKTMNVNSSFKTVSTNDISNAGSYLSRAKMGREKNGNGQWGAEFKMTIPEDLRNSNYDLRLEANVKADYHYNVFYNAYNHWDVSYADIYGVQKLKAAKEKDEQWQPVSTEISCTTFSRLDGVATYKVGHEPGASCECGSTAVSGSTFYILKNSKPYITNAYLASNADGSGAISGGLSFGTKKQITAYVVLEFSEDIRFSDNMGEALKLNLDAYYTKNGQSVDDSIVEATLKSMTSQKMIFEFSVPNQIGGTNTDIYIQGISSQQDFVNGSFDLFIYDKDGTKFECGTQKSTSYLTDLVGNPLNWENSDKSLGNIHFDNVAPVMTGISMTGSMITDDSNTSLEDWDDGKSRSAIYAGVGDWVSFQVSFSENITGFNTSNVNAVLTISNTDGTAESKIKLGASYFRNNTLYFNKLTITESMKAAGTKIEITGLEGMSSVKDSYGNSLAAGSNYSQNLTTIKMSPSQGIYLDVDAPIIAVTSDVTVENNVYTPIPTAKVGEYFTFPLIISEDVSKTNYGNTSWINTLPAEFSIVMPGEQKAYSWYVDTNKTVDESASRTWNNANTGATEAAASKNVYYPVDGQVFYVHVRLDSTIDYNYTLSIEESQQICFNGTLYVYAKDQAGNQTTASFSLEHPVDVNVPTGSVESTASLKVDYASLTASLTASFEALDDYGLKKLTYYWTDMTDSANPVTKTPVTLTFDPAEGIVKEYQADEVAYQFSFEADGDGGRKGSAKLSVAIEDYTGKSYEMESEVFEYDFTMPTPQNLIKTGTAEKPVTLPEVYILEPTKKGSDGGSSDTRTVMFIKTGENEDGTSNYWGYDTRAKSASEDGSYSVNYTEEDLIALLMSSSSSNVKTPGHWIQVTGNIDAQNRTGVFSETDSSYVFDSSINQIQEFLKNTYGAYEVTFVTSQDFNTTKNAYNLKDSAYNFNASTSQVEVHTVYLSNHAEYQVTAGAVKDAQGQDAEDLLQFESGDTPAQNLDNVAITVQIENVTDGEEAAKYNLAALDTKNSKIELHYFGVNSSGHTNRYADDVVYEWPMVSTNEQTVVIPTGAATEIGWYGIWVTTCNANGEVTYTKLDKFFFMDPTVLELNISEYKKTYQYEKIENEGTEKEKTNSRTLKARRDYNLSSDEDGVIELALGTAPNEYWSLDTALTFLRTTRTGAQLKYGVADTVKVRVYNKADTNYESNAIWIDADADTTQFVYEPVCVEEITKAGYGTADALKLPLYQGDNLVCMELVNANGAVTVNETLIYVSMPYEGVDINYTVDKVSPRTGGMMQVTVTADLPVDVEPLVEKTTNYNDSCLADGENSLLSAIPSQQSYADYKTHYTYTKDIAAEFFVLDQNGNLYAEYIEVEGVDGETPIVVTDNNAYDTLEVFNFHINVQDQRGGVDAEDITVTFDTDYSALLLGLTGEERTNNEIQVSMKLPVNREKDAEGNYLPWESYETSNNGIFRTLLHDESEIGDGGFVHVEVWGVFKFDAEVDSGDREAPENRTLTITAMDANGNSASSDRVYNYRNTPYYISTGIAVEDGGFDWYQSFYEDGTLGIYADIPFNKIHSYGAGEQKEAYYEWAGWNVYYTTAPMILQDGEYIFQVTDLFGDNHELPVYVYAYESLGIDVYFSETNATNQDVTAYVTALLEGDYITSISGITDAGKTVQGTIDEADSRVAQIVMPDNGTVTVETHLGNTRIIPVLNIDKVLEPAEVVFYTADGNEITGNEGEVDDVVTAVVRCGETLYGTNGALSHEFRRGSKAGSSYTFEYMDAAGNQGTVKAVLPVDIAAPAEEAEDETAPKLTLALFGKRLEKFNSIAEITNPDGAEITGTAGCYKAQEYRMVLTIIDDSDTKIVIQNPGEAAPTDYNKVQSASSAEFAELKANNVTVTENTEFDLYVIDENNNVTAVTGIQITGVNKVAVEYYADYQVGYDEDGYTIVTATFLPVNPEDDLEPITILDKTLPTRQVQTSVENPEYDPEDEYCYEDPYLYQERAYRVFEDNGAYVFRYRDEMGNLGEVLAQVQSMSTAAAVVENVLWYGTRGNAEPGQSEAVNTDVTADLTMSKAVSEVNLYRYDAEAENGYGELLSANVPVSVTTTSKSIKITYTENVDYRIAVEFKAAESGRKGYYVLPEVNCIDKTAPIITLEKAEVTSNKRSMEFTFTSNEAALLPEDYQAGYAMKHSWMATDNQPKELRFSDKAGNITIYQVTENAIVDVTRLEVVYSTDGTDANTVTDAVNGLKLDIGEDFYIKTNKAAAVKLNETEQGSVQANTWTKFTLPEEAGVHILKLIDQNTGEMYYDNVAAQPKDRIPPTIHMDSNSVVLLEGTSAAVMLEKIKEGITVTDDVDADGLDYTVTGYPQETNAGLYTLTYHAEDAAGNQTTISRTLYIMKAGTALLTVNGEAALPYGTTILSEKEISLEMSNIGTAGETPVIKWRSGMRTTAQMKHSTETVENMQFTVPEAGFYTIYVRTQDRTEYVTYIYVEE